MLEDPPSDAYKASMLEQVHFAVVKAEDHFRVAVHIYLCPAQDLAIDALGDDPLVILEALAFHSLRENVNGSAVVVTRDDRTVEGGGCDSHRPDVLRSGFLVSVNTVGRLEGTVGVIAMAEDDLLHVGLLQNR